MPVVLRIVYYVLEKQTESQDVSRAREATASKNDDMFVVETPGPSVIGVRHSSKEQKKCTHAARPRSNAFAIPKKLLSRFTGKEKGKGKEKEDKEKGQRADIQDHGIQEDTPPSTEVSNNPQWKAVENVKIEFVIEDRPSYNSRGSPLNRSSRMGSPSPMSKNLIAAASASHITSPSPVLPTGHLKNTPTPVLPSPKSTTESPATKLRRTGFHHRSDSDIVTKVENGVVTSIRDPKACPPPFF
eukprot:g24277.t1